MRVLVSGSTATMRHMESCRNLGVLFNPNSSNYRKQIFRLGMPWAADNAAYTGFDAMRFERMLDTLYIRQLPNCLFIAAPDVVADPHTTLRLFSKWLEKLRRYSLPLAFVAQDGLTVRMTPWQEFDVLFIGGSTRWKLGIHAYTLAAYAKAIGKNVHVGRVNSPMRLEMFSDIADTVDGTATSRYGDIFIPLMTSAAARGNKYGMRTPQRELW